MTGNSGKIVVAISIWGFFVWQSWHSPESGMKYLNVGMLVAWVCQIGRPENTMKPWRDQSFMEKYIYGIPVWRNE